MSLKPEPIEPVPEETARIARAAFPKGNLCLRLRDTLGSIYSDQLFADLFPARGQPAEAPWRLALVTILQFVEGLSDRQATEAVRARIDWKYMVSLPLSDPGFDDSVLSEFRSRLVAGGAELRLLEVLLEQCQAHGWLKARGSQRSDSTHVLAAVRALNRLELVGETLRHALNVLAEVAPAWLRDQITLDWFDRYSHRVEDYRLPKGKEARGQHTLLVGADGLHLLAAVEAESAPPWLRELPAILFLKHVWEQQYVQEQGQLRLKTAQELAPAGERPDSPYDPEACFGNKRSTTWTGYKVHLTETCDETLPHLITDVQTTQAHITDILLTAPIHQALADKDLLPDEHLVDAGYVDADLLLTSQAKHQLTLIGPVRPNSSWQAKKQAGYDVASFHIDWEAHRATCPQGHRSSSWTKYQDAWGNDAIAIRFAYKDCRWCPVRTDCTKAREGPRHLAVRPEAGHATLVQMRAEQEKPEWKARYNQRAGIEGTLSQGIRVAGLRQARYVGQAKAHLQHVATAAALNLLRLDAWWEKRPLAKTRRSRFAALAPAS
jgi:transposase